MPLNDINGRGFVTVIKRYSQPGSISGASALQLVSFSGSADHTHALACFVLASTWRLAVTARRQKKQEEAIKQ